MMRKRFLGWMLVVVVALPSSLWAADHDLFREAAGPPFAGEGPFVEVPAAVGGGLGALTGWAGSVVTGGVGLLIGGGLDLGARLGYLPPGEYARRFAEKMALPVQRGGFQAGRYLLGGPAWVLKNGLVDGPRRLISGRPASPSATAPEPRPANVAPPADEPAADFWH